MDRRRVAAFVVLPAIVLFALRPVWRIVAHAKSEDDDEAELTGRVRPRKIPPSWLGEPLPQGEGWRWSDPKDRGNAVRIYRGHADAPDPVDRGTYLVITVKGRLLDVRGQPTGESLRD